MILETPAAAATEPAAHAERRAFLDPHCHTSASFDSLSSPAAVVRAAAARGITHLAITDHDRLDGAWEARRIAEGEAAPVQVLVGQEIRTTAGDLIGLFLTQSIPPGLTAVEAIAEVRAQGGLVGIAHPYDRFRGSVGRTETAALESVARSVDWIEAWNARIVFGDGNMRAAELAVRLGVPGVAASDAHTTLEVGIASTVLRGDPSTPDRLREALAGPRELVMGRASAYLRLLGPLAKVIQARRGNGRAKPSSAVG